MDRLIDRRARSGGNPQLVAAVARLLAERWDPAGEFATPDGADTPEAHAAAVLGISESAVKVRLHRAHARLRELVEADR